MIKTVSPACQGRPEAFPYLVFGLGLTVGAKITSFGGPDRDMQDKGYWGETKVNDDPNPK